MPPPAVTVTEVVPPDTEMVPADTVAVSADGWLILILVLADVPLASVTVYV